ncbi:MAG: ATP-binding cassette domain-containing protein [Anaerovoracaceae bacterium]|nr:ATP-binding cassette domain-containing protein [Bacillota bacterium]MEE0516793.1 ATP-binding cassette domain-containing protein [Anaerovoracaceae bacterium]
MKICTINNEKCITRIRKIAVCLFWIVIWHIMSVLVQSNLLLPGPADTACTLIELAGTSEFYINIGWTCFRCICAMILSFAAGAAAAAASYRFKTVRSLMSLPVGFFKAVPVMAVIIYVILIASADLVAVIVCFLMCFPIVYTNILSGLDYMGNELKELSYVYNLTATEKVKYIYIPKVMPQINSAVKLIAGLSWKAVVAAEVLSIPKYSLGYEMMNAKYYLQTSALFSYVIVIIALSIAVERLITFFMKKTKIKAYYGSKLIKGLRFTKENVGECELSECEPPEVSLKGIGKSFDGKRVLSGINVVFKKGKVTVVEGPSGTGKTTLGRIISGLDTFDEGEMIADSNFKLTYLFQEDRLLPWLNVYDNLALGLLRDKKTERKGDKKDSSPEDDVIEMAKKLELSEYLYKLPEELSGGMKHRVALGRTFLANSDMMILDEPFRGLNDELIKRIMDRLWNDVVKEKTVIVITHQPEIFTGYNKLKI